MTVLKETIESQFSLEILLKHRELRLIDQELAKCQVMLEQLRRCQVIPYPAMSSNTNDMQAVSSGSEPEFENRVPHPSPWGVVNGPYSRHYAKWLIPDAAFDVDVAETTGTPQFSKEMPERSTRASVSGKNNFTSSLRSQRVAASTRLQALPHGYPEQKVDRGPLILKRSTDGQSVKLVCPDCHRDNFHSAQGFINHCRIAHSRGFASHDAAAIVCGEEVELGTGDTTGESSTPANSMAGLVHPLIRSANVMSSAPATPSTLSLGWRQVGSATGTEKSTGPSLGVSTFPSTPRLPPSVEIAPLHFAPSPQTPHLSALFAKMGRDDNLDELVNQAKTKADIDMDGYSSNDDESGQDTTDTFNPPSNAQSLSTRGIIHGTRLPARATISPAPLERSPSNKGVHGSRKLEPLTQIARRGIYTPPGSLSVADTPAQEVAQGRSTLPDVSPTLNLSPTNIESHPAPSLISDDDGDEYENTHSESESVDLAEDDNDDDGGRYLGFGVEEHDGTIEALEGSASADLGLATTPVKPHSPAARRSSALRSPATTMRPGNASDRRVSFASPNKRSRGDGPSAARKRGEK